MKLAEFWDYLFPAQCFGCGQATTEGRAICFTCLRGALRPSALCCPTCRARAAAPAAYCHPPAHFYLLAVADYHQPAVGELVRAFKFEGLPSAGQALRELLALGLEKTDRSWLEEPVVVPVPLGRKRLRQREFNQAEYLASAVAELWGLPCLPKALGRVRETSPQSELTDRKARQLNIKDCFAAPHPDLVTKRDIVLVDDVITSGATLREAAETLRRAGAGRILAVVAAAA